MTGLRLWLLAGWLAATAAGIACGKRGNPLPPLRPVPSAAADLAAARIGNTIELRWTIPASNVDGTMPPAVTRVEIYAMRGIEGVPAPPPAVIASEQNRRGELRVRPVPTAGTSPPASSSPPSPVTTPRDPAAGEGAIFRDVVPAEPRGLMHYLVIGIAGGGRGRSGPPSGVVSVPLGPIAAMTDPPTLEHDERNIRVSWTSSGSSLRFRVATGPRASVTTAIGEPVASDTVSVPVTFGEERCFAVTPILVASRVTVEGNPSPFACLTAVDRFPPPAPLGLEAVLTGTSVTLNWSAVDAPDLAGYVVLRGDGSGDTLQPLMRAPIRETTYTDAAVTAGTTYTYSVYAVDNAPVGNVSQQSNRETVTVR